MYKAFLADKLIGVAGAREILILNLPPMDKLPTELNASDKDEGIGIRAWVDAYNTRLRRVIDEIQEEHSDKVCEETPKPT